MYYQRFITKYYYTLFLKSCGSRSIIFKPLFWNPSYIKIGQGVTIQKHCRIQAIYRRHSKFYQPEIRIEDNVTIEQGCHIGCLGKLVIGKGTTISSYVLIQDVDHEYRQLDVDILKQPLIYKKIVIGENSFIGSGAKILAGTNLGKQCIVGSNSVVRGVYPDYSVIAGSPAKIVKRYNFVTKVWEKVSKTDGIS